MDGASRGMSAPECSVHRRQSWTRGQVVSGSTGWDSWYNSNENQDSWKVKQVVERRHECRKRDTWARKTKMWTTFGWSSLRECSAVYVIPEMDCPNVERLPAHPLSLWGLESCKICWPLGCCNCGCSNSQTGQASKYFHTEGGDAEADVLTSKSRWPALQDTAGQ